MTVEIVEAAIRALEAERSHMPSPERRAAIRERLVRLARELNIERVALKESQQRKNDS